MTGKEIDRDELLREISNLVSAKAFNGISPSTTAEEFRERCDEYGLIMGRITAVVLADSIDTGLLFSIRELTAATQQKAWDGLSATIRPGGEMSRIVSESLKLR
ncbi:hypothetical protein N5C60_01670 [Pseudomonas mosselii]|uniref:hypothetical protein n=1 Tax=Pseudomonas mosselii TaxID=78327 RepID=UPI00244D0830|nr:hypothetical protein [Pseudomonas mosselii]MDH1143319.1 hypothetical protein [Pseudomonas mosselii]